MGILWDRTFVRQLGAAMIFFGCIGFIGFYIYGNMKKRISRKTVEVSAIVIIITLWLTALITFIILQP
jgi:cell shape-determining protein MreD